MHVLFGVAFNIYYHEVPVCFAPLYDIPGKSARFSEMI